MRCESRRDARARVPAKRAVDGTISSSLRRKHGEHRMRCESRRDRSGWVPTGQPSRSTFPAQVVKWCRASTGTLPSPSKNGATPAYLFEQGLKPHRNLRVLPLHVATSSRRHRHPWHHHRDCCWFGLSPISAGRIACPITGRRCPLFSRSSGNQSLPWCRAEDTIIGSNRCSGCG